MPPSGRSYITEEAFALADGPSFLLDIQQVCFAANITLQKKMQKPKCTIQ